MGQWSTKNETLIWDENKNTLDWNAVRWDTKTEKFVADNVKTVIDRDLIIR
jgi:hypothetical protein